MKKINLVVIALIASLLISCNVYAGWSGTFVGGGYVPSGSANTVLNGYGPITIWVSDNNGVMKGVISGNGSNNGVVYGNINSYVSNGTSTTYIQGNVTSITTPNGSFVSSSGTGIAISE